MPGGPQHAAACGVVDRRGKLTMLSCRWASADFSRMPIAVPYASILLQRLLTGRANVRFPKVSMSCPR